MKIQRGKIKFFGGRSYGLTLSFHTLSMNTHDVTEYFVVLHLRLGRSIWYVGVSK